MDVAFEIISVKNLYTIVVLVEIIIILILIIFLLSSINNKKKELDTGLIFIKQHYAILRKGIKLIWFIIVFITIIFLVINNIGSNNYINFSNISRNDIMFLVIMAMIFLPMFTNYKIKTPFLDADSNSPEEIVSKTAEKTKLEEQVFNNKIKYVIKSRGGYGVENSDHPNKMNVINELKKESEKLASISEDIIEEEE